MRTLVIESSGNLWGSERALLDLLDASPQLQMAVCCPHQTPLKSMLERRQIRTFPYFVSDLHRRPRWRRLQASVGVLRASLEFRPDIIYLNQSGAFRVTLPAATLLDIPIIGHIRIFEDAAYLASQAPHEKRLRAIIAISAAIEEEIRKFESLKSIKLHRIYDAYCATSKSNEMPRHGAHVGNRIVCVGRLVPIKGQD